MKDQVLTICLLIIMLLNFNDVFTDFYLDVPVWHIIEEMCIVILAGLLAAYLMIDMRKRTKRLNKLHQQLASTTEQLQQMTNQFRTARRVYFQEINEQFERWALTQSEKEVALLMLKGLSFQDIASVRSTKEKTVRQQASTIYSKAQLEGRHALSAWFFEDILQPQPSA
jgi:DNA-binding NarL/FixJ family response regulator